MKLKAAVSNRHVHLTEQDKNILFGENYEFNKLKDLVQTGQYACTEKVDIKTDKDIIKGVRILGPVRHYTQVELSVTDSNKLGINPPLRDSGDLNESETVIIVGPCGEVKAKNSTIIAHRHIHMTPYDAEKFDVNNNDLVNVKVEGIRGGIFKNVRIKVDESYVLEVHIDRDEANAFFVSNGDEVTILKA